MISREKAISIAKKATDEKGFKVDKVVLEKNIYYIALSKGKKAYEVDIDARTGKIIGGAGGAPGN